jgi:hypothetical protein
MSLTATVNGPSQFIDRLAFEWTRHFLDIGVPREYLDQIFSLCRFLVASMIVSGWVIAALFTVAVLRIVFGFLN